MQSRFEVKKRRILQQLDIPDEDYHDLSPKGSVDEPIRPLIRTINAIYGLVTTSSCSGRISIFLEGKKKGYITVQEHVEEDVSRAGPGGKGGGSWLYISHTPVKIVELFSDKGLMSAFNLSPSTEGADEEPGSEACYIHLKFEPMILHILSASLEHSQRVITAAMNAGFRESGAVSINATKTGERNPMVAVRSTGYSFDSIIGYQDSAGNNVALIDEKCLQTLFKIANDRFKTNEQRIARFQTALLELYSQGAGSKVSDECTASPVWEDAAIRKQRKRDEGLQRQREKAEENNRPENEKSDEDAGIDDMFS